LKKYKGVLFNVLIDIYLFLCLTNAFCFVGYRYIMRLKLFL